MGRKRMKNKEREETNLHESRVLLIESALEEGITSKIDIAKATGLKIWDINNVFAKDRKLYSKFCVRRKILVDVAVDNIEAILNDRSHPQNYQASKHIITTYKTDLDDILESKEVDDISVLVEGGESQSPVTIVFGRKKSKEESEE